MALKEKISKFSEKHSGLCEIIRFLIVGGVATVVDYLVMGLIKYAFQPKLYPHFYNVFYGADGKSETSANIVGTGGGFIAGLIVNYVFSISFVFTHKGNSKSVGGFLSFALLSAVGLGIHLLGMYLGNGVWGINEWIVKIVLTLIVLVYNYVSKRLLIFKKAKTEQKEMPARLKTPFELRAGNADSVYKDNGGEEKMKISVIVPCYNEEECIEKYYEAMKPIRAKIPASFEFIFVDDGSKDRTLEILRGLSSLDDEVRYVSFSRNFGKEAAMYAGLKAATGDLVSLMDADLQDPPEMLIEMYNGIISEGYDCVACRRADRKGENKIRSAFARLFYKIINRVSDADIMDGARDFRLMTRRMVDSVLALSETERFSKGIFGWVGFKTKWLDYKNVERVAGKTKFNFRKLTKYAIGGIEDFSVAPLKFNLVLSVISFIAALAFAVFDIVWRCTGHTVYEMFIVMPVMLFMFSMLFFGITILGEYVKKIFYEAKDRPVYIVRETEEDLNAYVKASGDGIKVQSVDLTESSIKAAEDVGQKEETVL